MKKNILLPLFSNFLLTFLNKLSSYYRVQLSKRVHKYSSSRFTLIDALFFPRSIDLWSRLMLILREFNNLNTSGNCSILDLGAGNGRLENLLNPEVYSVVSCDISKTAIKNLKAPFKLVCDGCTLPFTDNCFDYATSIDVIEHIPKANRNRFFSELKRVCNKNVILTCPLQNDDGRFQGRTFDYIFQCLYEKKHGLKEYNTEEHIKSEHPTLKEINQLSQNFELIGYKNCEIWLKYMLFSRERVISFFSGFIYYFFWSKHDNKPPFWGAMIKVNCIKDSKGNI